MKATAEKKTIRTVTLTLDEDEAIEVARVFGNIAHCSPLDVEIYQEITGALERRGEELQSPFYGLVRRLSKGER